MAKRFGLGVALPVALVALVFAQSGCGGGGSGGTGTGGAAGKAGHGGNGGGAVNLGGTSGGGVSGGGVSGGGVSGIGGLCAGDSCGGRLGTGGQAGAAGQGGAGGQAGIGGAGGQGASDGGQDAATDGGNPDAHHGDAGTDAQVDGATDAAPTTCTNACVLGSHRCAGAGSQTCVMGGDGCTAWGTTAPCAGATTCATGTGVCVCPSAPAGCTASGTFCTNTGEVVACTRDAQGCFSASAPQACPVDQSCKGSLPNAACACDNDPSCHGTNTYCLNASTVATCGSDGNQPACNVVVSTHACGGSSACMGGACVCPAAGTTAGTGCSTLNATMCSGTDILICVTESTSGCNLWQASTHCSDDGLICGTKAGGGPACQCPENTGTDVFVDPAAGSDVAAGLFPTGVQNPPACRFATLTKGLSVVGSPGRVVALTANPPVKFIGETFPLAVPAGITLTTGDASPNAADYQIAYSGGAASAVNLAGGSALRGFSIDATGAAAALVTCTSGTVTLDTLLLSGGGTATAGLEVANSCNATLLSTSIVDFAGPALAVSTSGMVGVTGGLLSASLIGLSQTNGTVSASGLAVQSNGQYGIRLSGSGSPMLTITGQTVVANNGTTGNYAGVSVAKGNASITNTQVTGNGGAGLELASGGTYVLDTVQASSNTKSGVSLLSGGLTATGLSATVNGIDGVTVNGGSAALTNATLATNAFNGLNLLAAVPVDVNGGTIQSNTTAGINGGVGTLTVHGGADIAGNGTGVQLTGAAASITGANVHGNLGSGISVNEASGVTVAIGSSSTTTTVASNQQQGIVVQSAPAISGSGANSIIVDTATVTGNGSFGIYLEGGFGSVAATIKGSSISGNSDTGLMIEQGLGHTTTEAIQNNDIKANNTKASPRNVGGVLFNTSSTLTSFIGNTVHSNGGDEVGFNALPNGGTKWTITPPSNACDATANSVYCYGTGNVGVHVIAAGASVDAQHQHWTNNPATSGIDYTGTVTVLNPCTAVPTCP